MVNSYSQFYIPDGDGEQVNVMIMATVWTAHIHVTGSEIPHACIWTADGIASCYATTQTAISILVPSQNAPFDTPPSAVAFEAAGHTFLRTLCAAPISENYSWQQHDLYPDDGMVILACPQQQPIILLLQILTSEYMFSFGEIRDCVGCEMIVTTNDIHYRNSQTVLAG